MAFIRHETRRKNITDARSSVSFLSALIVDEWEVVMDTKVLSKGQKFRYILMISVITRNAPFSVDESCGHSSLLSNELEEFMAALLWRIFEDPFN